MQRHWLVLLALMCVVGCDSQTGIGDPELDGEVSLRLVRSQASLVPSIADSALVRVWHPTAGTNQIKRVEIPDPGAETIVQFSLPSRTGYNVAVLAFDGSPAKLVAGGATQGVAVQAGQNTEVILNVAPWIVELNIPDTLISGEAVTITGAIHGPVSGIFDTQRLHFGLEPWTDDGASAEYAHGGSFFSEDSLSISFNAPAIDGTATLWLQLGLRIQGSNHTAWGLSGHSTYFVPSLLLGDTLYHRPVTTGSGSLTIVFDQ